MVIKYMELSNHYFDKHNNCSSYSCSQFSISLIDSCVYQFIPAITILVPVFHHLVIMI